VDAVRAQEAAAGEALEVLKADGGAVSNRWLMQFQADVLGVPVVRPKVLETTALGAAYLAGLAVGYWESDEQIGRNWKVDRHFDPSAASRCVLESRGCWREAVARARNWIPDSTTG